MDPRADLREAALRVRIHDVMQRDVLCVREDASVEMARSLLLEHAVRALPVVDAEGKLVGFVTRSDLLRDDDDRGNYASIDAPRGLGRGFHVEELARRVVGEVMTPYAHALPEAAPLSYAVSLMAMESLTDIPVVTENGEVVGVVTSVDVMRWFAERLGYVIP
jgi:CBS-domain-containing membrane protein